MSLDENLTTPAEVELHRLLVEAELGLSTGLEKLLVDAEDSSRPRWAAGGCS